MTIKKTTQRQITSNTHYHGCTFYLDENKWYEIEHSHFTHCSFRGSIKLKRLYKCTFDHCGFSHFVTLDLAMQQLGEVPNWLLTYTFLSHLNLARNQITVIPPQIACLKNLVYLNFYQNDIVEVPIELSKLQNLTALDLEGNYIQNLPPELGKLRELSLLYLDDNNIREFPEELQHLNLSRVHLSRNRFDEIQRERIKSYFPNCKIIL